MILRGRNSRATTRQQGRICPAPTRCVPFHRGPGTSECQSRTVGRSRGGCFCKSSCFRLVICSFCANTQPVADDTASRKCKNTATTYINNDLNGPLLPLADCPLPPSGDRQIQRAVGYHRRGANPGPKR